MNFLITILFDYTNYETNSKKPEWKILPPDQRK